jgi:glyoxylate utilization-related uncharacterized protein
MKSLANVIEVFNKELRIRYFDLTVNNIPHHFHTRTEEELFVISGIIEVNVNGEVTELNGGEHIQISIGDKHSFSLKGFCYRAQVIEISRFLHHFPNVAQLNTVSAASPIIDLEKDIVCVDSSPAKIQK